MKQVIGCVIRKIQASQNVPKENQMVKTTIKKQYDTKQNKRMADIYSLHLQWNWGSTFSVNTSIRDVHLSVRGHRWSWCQPVWGETFILRREKCTVSHPQGLELRPGLPAVLLVMVTTVNGPKSYRRDSSLQLGQTSQLQALGLGGAKADGHSQARGIVTVRSEGKQGSTGLEASASKSSNSQLGVFCLTSDQSQSHNQTCQTGCAGFYSSVFCGCCGGSLRR